MARQLRIGYPGAFYHITSKGYEIGILSFVVVDIPDLSLKVSGWSGNITFVDVCRIQVKHIAKETDCMNIGIVTTWFDRGAAYVSKAYMDVLSKDHNIYIYARGGEKDSKGDPRWDLPNVTYGERYKPLDTRHQLFTKYTRAYIDMLHFEAWLSDNDIDTVIFNEERNDSLLRRTKGLGYTIGAYIDYYKKDTVRQFRIYDFLLCNTKRHYSVFRNFPNAFYFPWGTDLNLFKPKICKKNVDGNDSVVFFHSAGFGGFNNRKGTDLLLKAFQKVRGSVKLIIHSQVPVSKYGDEASDLMSRDGRIQFIEKIVPAPGLYHLGDVFVYPSRLEGIGLSIPEALACGLPVITTDNAPMNEFVEDGVNGLLVRVKETRMRVDGYYWPENIADVDDLAKKMQVYVDDRDLLAQHKRQARESAETMLDWMKNASELSHELQGILKESDRRRRRARFSERVMWWCEAQYVAFLTCASHAARKAFRRT